jgi:hypothetical protein
MRGDGGAQITYSFTLKVSWGYLEVRKGFQLRTALLSTLVPLWGCQRLVARNHLVYVFSLFEV